MKPCVPLDLSADFQAFPEISKQLRQIIQEFYTSGAIYTMSMEQLAKSFLGNALCNRYFVEEFETMRNDYVESACDTDAPISEEEFYVYIVKLYFDIDIEPKGVLLECYRKAMKHLNEIEFRISKINDDIKLIKSSKDPSKEQQQLPVLNYFLERNQSAVQEILDFVKTKAEAYALSQCDSVRKTYFSFGSMRYFYDVSPAFYEVKYPTAISNKFQEFGRKERTEIQQMYSERNDEFKDYLNQYIENNAIVHLIRVACDENYVVAVRRGLVEEALRAYESHNNVAFSSMCVFIIEGILHHICILFDIPENDILGAGFQAKLNKLQKEERLGLNYEYYSFVFRLLRNKMAHGLGDATELQEMAGLLLLDLHDVIKVSTSMQIPVNSKRFFLHQSLKDTKPDRYAYALGYLCLHDVTVPTFYNVVDDHEKLITLLSEEKCWEYVDSLLTGTDESMSVAYEMLARLKVLKNSAIEQKRTERLSKKRTIDAKFNKIDFVKSLIQYG